MLARRHLAWLTGTLAVAACLDLVFGLLRTHFLTGLTEGASPDQIGRSLRTLYTISGPTLFVAVGAVGLQLARVARRLEAGPGRAVLWGALGLVLLAEADAGCRWLASMTEAEAYFALLGSRWVQLVLITVHFGWAPLAALGLGLAAGRRGDGLALSVGGAAVVAGILFVAISQSPAAFGESFARATWLRFALFTGGSVVGLAAAAVTAWRLRGRIDEREPEPGAEAGPAAWTRAAGGLRLYASALSWRLGLTVGGYGLLLFAGLGRHAGLAKLLAWLLPVAVVATSAVMLAGLVRFTQQPGHSPGKAPAGFAAAVLGTALIVDLYLLISTLSLLTASPTDYSAAIELRDKAEALGSVGVWGMALGFAHVVALLAAFWRLARRVADAPLASSIVGVGLAIAATGGAAVWLRSWIGGGSLGRSDVGSTMVLGGAVAIAALFTITVYIGLVRRVEEAIRERGNALDLPSSRLARDPD